MVTGARTRPASGGVIALPAPDGSISQYRMHEPASYPRPTSAFTARRCLAAPHVVVDALAEYTPGLSAPVDWDRTIAFRRHLWSYGIGVAEAMDTTERGPGGLTWAQARQLIALSLDAARDVGGDIVCGAGTEQISWPHPTLDDIVEAYNEQVEFIESRGGGVVVRVSHELAAIATSEDDYRYVYDAVLRACSRRAIVHWLGTAFDETLAGYWGHTDRDSVTEAVLRFADDNADRLAGIKYSLLDAAHEKQLRRRLPAGVPVYTGDDYDYPDLLAGDNHGASHGLLGILDPIAPAASKALQALETGSAEQFRDEMQTTVGLAKRLFQPPAARYKTGVVFLAYLSGHQPHCRMVSGREGLRSVAHLVDLFRMADALGLFSDPDLARHRMSIYLAAAGVGGV